MGNGAETGSAQALVDVRFTPESGQTGDIADCPLCAKSGQTQRSKESLVGHLVGNRDQRRRHGDSDRQVTGFCACLFGIASFPPSIYRRGPDFIFKETQ
jgi:hypothetical protein